MGKDENGEHKGSKRKGRYYGTAIDARDIAEKLIAGQAVPRPKRSGRSNLEIQKLYCNAVQIQAIYKLEKLLQDENVDERKVKAVVAILDAVRDHGAWADSLIPKRKKKPKDQEDDPEKKPEEESDATSRIDGYLEE